MRINEYQNEAMRTASGMNYNEHGMLINAALGLCGESGEVADLVKKATFQGHELDVKPVKPDYVTFTKNKGECVFKANDPEHLSTIFLSVLQMWKQHIMYLNEQENIILAEYRDAILPDFMSGKLEI